MTPLFRDYKEKGLVIIAIGLVSLTLGMLDSKYQYAFTGMGLVNVMIGAYYLRKHHNEVQP